MKTYRADIPDPDQVAAARRLVTDADTAATLPDESIAAAWRVMSAARKPQTTFPPATSAALTVRLRRAA